MQIPYRPIGDYEPVDLAALRPKDSYKTLMQQRTHSIDALVAEHGQIPSALLQPRACPTCGADDAAHELDKDHMTLVRCRACDLVYVSPTFDEHHYREMYGSKAYQGVMKDLGEASHQYRVERFGRERVGLMARHLEVARPRYLDVGCSTGFVVEAARDAGWDALGIDLNPSAIEFGRARGLNLRVAALEDEAFAPGAFDAVSLFDVLEHLPEPRAIAARASELLAPGGILFLYVPNYDSASRLLMGKHAHFIWPTHHLNYYTPRTLTDFLTRQGLEVTWVVTEGLDLADYVWYRREVLQKPSDALEEHLDTLQFLANAGAYGKNLRAIARKPR